MRLYMTLSLSFVPSHRDVPLPFTTNSSRIRVRANTLGQSYCKSKRRNESGLEF